MVEEARQKTEKWHTVPKKQNKTRKTAHSPKKTEQNTAKTQNNKQQLRLQLNLSQQLDCNQSQSNTVVPGHGQNWCESIGLL